MRKTDLPFVRYCAKTGYFLDCRVVAPDARIIYIISGEGEFISDGRSISISPSTLVYYPPRTPYHIRSKEGMLFYTLNFDFDSSMWQDSPIPFTPTPEGAASGYDSIEPPAVPDFFKDVITIPNARALEMHLHGIYTEMAKLTASASAEAASAWLKLLLIDIQRGATATKNPVIDKIKALIKEDLRRNNIELAALMSYHPYYLNQLFSSSEGESLHKYIMRQRAAEARELITSTTLPFDKIAELVGISSASYLSRTIREHYGITPSALRRM